MTPLDAETEEIADELYTYLLMKWHAEGKITAEEADELWNS